MNIKVIFGVNLKYYRKQRGLSQEQLSELVDITQKHLSKIETGTTFVSAELLEKLSSALSISASALFYSPEEKSGDDSMLNNMDQIVEDELKNTINEIKLKFRRLK
jgi:transcriptional regulator with XRE-family HTH domain